MIDDKIHLIVATHNPNKVHEFNELLGKDYILQHLSIDDPEAIEDGKSYFENALIKAKSAANDYPQAMVIADDSGIEVSALKGDPGISTARYAGADCTIQDSVLKVIDDIKDSSDRCAKYICCLVLIDHNGREYSFTGECSGKLTFEPRGENGFAFDRYFVPDTLSELNDHSTLAQLTSDQKHKISHRGQATKLLRAKLDQAKAN